MSRTLIQDNLKCEPFGFFMTSDALLKAFRERFKQRNTWAAVFVFIGAWGLVRIFMGWGEGSLPPQLLSLALLLFGHIFLSPLPWQWTNDARPLAGIMRGVSQALAWNLIWLFGTLLVIDLIFPGHGRHFVQYFPSLETSQKSLLDALPEQGACLMPILINLPFAMLLGWFLADKDRSEQLEKQLIEGEREARTQALQTQLHPHALYNLLSGLTELVHEDPDATEDALIKLSDLLRNLTHHGAKRLVSFAEEKALVMGYLEIESIRLTSRLEVNWHWPDWADDLQLPPLLLQPLVENAIKHGIAAHPKGGILDISVSKEGDRAIIRVANTGLPMGTAAGRGVGIKNLRERLALMPQLSSSFTLINEEDWTVAELRLRFQA